MLTQPLWLTLYLCALVAVIQYLTRRYRQWPLWQWLPTPVWCYGLPMVATSLGFTPAASPVYDAVSRWLLPPTLFLLLLPARLRDLARAGPRAIACFAVGAAGIAAGLTTGFLLWRHYLPPEAWQGIGALAGTCRIRVVGYTLKRERVSAEYSAGIENVGYDAIAGLQSPMFLRTVKLKDFPWNGWLALGVAGPAAAAWNPIAGFDDPFGRLLWSALGDPAVLAAPNDAGWVLNRIADVRLGR